MALKNWSIATATSSLADLVQPASGKEAAIVGIIVTNYSGTNSNVDIVLTDSSNNIKGYILNDKLLADDDTYHIDTKIFLTNQEKIRVSSTGSNVSFIISGDES